MASIEIQHTPTILASGHVTETSCLILERTEAIIIVAALNHLRESRTRDFQIALQTLKLWIEINDVRVRMVYARKPDHLAARPWYVLSHTNLVTRIDVTMDLDQFEDLRADVIEVARGRV